MPVNLRGRSLTSVMGYTPDEVNFLVDLSLNLKKSKYQGLEKNSRPLVGKNIVILFQKDSTRTRCSFEVAAADLGASCTYIGSSGSNFGKKESIEDTAKVLGRIYDGIEFRGFLQEDVETLAKCSGVPVWNGLTNKEHPTQMFADLMTMKEKLGDLKGKKLVFCGDIPNNVAVSNALGGAFAGMEVVLAGPASYAKRFPKDVIKKCEELSKITGSSLKFESDMLKAVKDADVIYTDVWVSLGEPFELFETRIKDLKSYQVNMKAIKAAKDNVIFMHCLPAFHDDHTEFSMKIKEKFGKQFSEVATGAMEVTDDVFQSKHNVSFDQAENRLHSIKAIILATIGY